MSKIACVCCERSISNIKIYLYPLTSEWVSLVIEKEKPYGILGSFGGQTALNCLLELEEKKILEKYQVKNLGTSLDVTDTGSKGPGAVVDRHRCRSRFTGE